MGTVAVTDVGDPLGSRVARRLAAAGWSVVDADTTLDQAAAAPDVVVDLGRAASVTRAEPRVAGAAADRTRRLLERATACTRVVHLSSGMVYGAHPDNPVPLREDDPLRADPAFGWAYSKLLAEQDVRDWGAAHPATAVAVLRPATMLGPGLEDFVTRHLENPRVPLVRGHEPPLQVVHVDDLADAVALAVTGALDGVHNIAADGWLPAAQVWRLLGRGPLRVPEGVAFTMAQRLWDQGLGVAPPAALHHLMYPWVLDTARAAARGWRARYSNRDVLREFAEIHHAFVAAGPLRARRRTLWAAGAAAGAAAGFASRVALRRLRGA